MIDEEHLPDRNERTLIVLVLNIGIATNSSKDITILHRSSVNGRLITSLLANCHHIRWFSLSIARNTTTMTGLSLGIDELSECRSLDPRHHWRCRVYESVPDVELDERAFQTFVQVLWGTSMLVHARHPFGDREENYNGTMHIRVYRIRERSPDVASADVRLLDVACLRVVDHAEGSVDAPCRAELGHRFSLPRSTSAELFYVTSRLGILRKNRQLQAVNDKTIRWRAINSIGSSGRWMRTNAKAPLRGWPTVVLKYSSHDASVIGGAEDTNWSDLTSKVCVFSESIVAKASLVFITVTDWC